jgi:hypothetical protein
VLHPALLAGAWTATHAFGSIDWHIDRLGEASGHRDIANAEAAVRAEV